MIKKVGKLGLILIIISLCTSILQAQSDSTKLKRELTALLKKYGYSSFKININSYNQQGGQTAFSIVNNYADPNYIPDSINFVMAYIDSHKEYVSMYPKKGKWSTPFVMYPDTFSMRINKGEFWILGYCDQSHYSGQVSNVGYEIKYRNRPYSVAVRFLYVDCSETMPLCTNVKYPDCFFIFGDYSDQNKWYVYDFGEIKAFKNAKHFTQFKAPPPPPRAFVLPIDTSVR